MVDAYFAVETFEGIQGDLAYHPRFIPGTTPEKLAMIGPMGRAAQGFDESINGSAMADGDRHNQGPKMPPGRLAKVLLKRTKESFYFFGYPADSNHVASPTISSCVHKAYRQSRPFFFDLFTHYYYENRSV